MCKDFFDLSVFNELYGLSCVENLLLFILKSYQYSYNYLFYNSFLSFNVVANAFIKENAKYTDFIKIPRIQDTAIDIGILEMSLSNSLKFDDAASVKTLITVKPEYIKNKYNVELWRNDHYILIHRDCEQCIYINDNPRDSGVITLETLHNIFDGKVIKFKLNEDLTEDLKEILRQRFFDSLSKINQTIFLPSIDLSDLKPLRDALGIYKILTRRLYAFSSLCMNADFITEQIKYLDKQYMLIEYMRIKNEINYAAIALLANKVFENEKMIIKRIMSGIEE